jgi:hypothetical protein
LFHQIGFSVWLPEHPAAPTPGGPWDCWPDIMEELDSDCNAPSKANNETVWQPDEIVIALASGVERFSAALDAEHAVTGLDALDEVGLHPILQNALNAPHLGQSPDHTLGVHREFPYPTPTKLRPDHRERERCDLVLTEDRAAPPADPVRERKDLDQAVGTLFAPLADTIPSAQTTTPLEDCFWLEVKAVGQYTFTDGLPGPNRTYTSQLTQGPAADIRKLSRDPLIAHGGVLVLLFAADQPTAEHDVGVMVHKMLDRDLPISSPAIGSFPMNDRIGNSVCTLALVPLRPVR